MPWICEFCGWENLNDDRVGRREPSCTRCNHQRTLPVTDHRWENLAEGLTGGA